MMTHAYNYTLIALLNEMGLGSFSIAISGRYCKLLCNRVFFHFCSQNTLIIKSLPVCFSFIRRSPSPNRSLVGSDSVTPSFHLLAEVEEMVNPLSNTTNCSGPCGSIYRYISDSSRLPKRVCLEKCIDDGKPSVSYIINHVSCFLLDCESLNSIWSPICLHL